MWTVRVGKSLTATPQQGFCFHFISLSMCNGTLSDLLHDPVVFNITSAVLIYTVKPGFYAGIPENLNVGHKHPNDMPFTKLCRKPCSYKWSDTEKFLWRSKLTVTNKKGIRKINVQTLTTAALRFFHYLMDRATDQYIAHLIAVVSIQFRDSRKIVWNVPKNIRKFLSQRKKSENFES